MDRMDRLEDMLGRIYGALGLEVRDDDDDENESADLSICSGDPKSTNASSSISCGNKGVRPDAINASLSIGSGDEGVATGRSGAAETDTSVAAGPDNARAREQVGAGSSDDQALAATDQRDNVDPLASSGVQVPTCLPAPHTDRLSEIFSHPRDAQRESVLVGDGLASYLQKTHRHGLESKDLKALEERYKIPTNMPASAPIINKNIWEKLPKELKDADKKDKAVQALGVTALCPLLSVVETLTKAVGDNQKTLNRVLKCFGIKLCYWL